MYNGNKKWIDAKKQCEKDHAHLAIEYTAATHNFLKHTYGKKSTWIGATDSVHEGKWIWVDGKPVKRTYWGGHGEPNGKRNENCLQYNRFGPGTWNDVNCDTKLAFLCQKGNTFLSIQFDTNISLSSIPIFS